MTHSNLVNSIYILKNLLKITELKMNIISIRFTKLNRNILLTRLMEQVIESNLYLIVFLSFLSKKLCQEHFRRLVKHKTISLK